LYLKDGEEENILIKTFIDVSENEFIIVKAIKIDENVV